MGKAISLALAREGAELVLLDLNADGLEVAAAECREAGAEAVDCIICDLGKPAEISAAAGRLLHERGGVDILVNNAGIAYYGPTASMDAAQRERLLAVNLHAPIQLVSELLPSMLERYEAHVVNVASLFGLIGVPRTAVYHATKFGLVGFTESLRREYGRRRLGVTAVCPGFVRTNLFATGASGFKDRDIPQPPLWVTGTAEGVARKTVRAIYRDRRMVLATPLSYVGSYVQRLAPWSLDKLYRLGRRRKMRNRLRKLQERQPPAATPPTPGKIG